MLTVQASSKQDNLLTDYQEYAKSSLNLAGSYDSQSHSSVLLVIKG